MKLTCQKQLFSIEEGIHYLNCAYMSPLMKTVEQAGAEGLVRKRYPYRILPNHFFDEAVEVRALFAALVRAEPERVALIPSVSYGMGIIVQNIRAKRGQKVITVYEEFPSDLYSLHRICQDQGLELVTVSPPSDEKQRGRKWNEAILAAIQPDTVLVNISSVHWSDGTIFDLEAIGKKAKETGAMFVVDGTQSVGAVEMDVNRFQIDALVCAAYKWLLGPYTSGFIYLNNRFDEGRPIEESWMNRIGSENFRLLVDYQPEYHPKAGRYNMGEFSNFINLPMLKAALQQILEWTPAAINQYCAQLTAPLINHLNKNGFSSEEDSFRSNHLFGFRLPANSDIEVLQKKLAEKNIIISLRGNAVRVSPHLYNDEEDIHAFIEVLK
ncbi:MAG TPA: aminotransferase class V-fold PLP-dependent enzyme [Chitinophagaceae bacterium]